jgi:hypothetical protein
MFLNICHAASSLELNGLRIQTACLAEFHRSILSEASFSISQRKHARCSGDAPDWLTIVKIGVPHVKLPVGRMRSDMWE